MSGERATEPGKAIILNGAPRAGTSSIAAAIQESFEGVWMNLGADAYILEVTPAKFRPGIGLRPDGERPDLEPLLPVFYAALYESIAAHSRLGLNVVGDIGHHDSYSKPLGILRTADGRLAGALRGRAPRPQDLGDDALSGGHVHPCRADCDDWTFLLLAARRSESDPQDLCRDRAQT
jgi:hypothetical protein